MKRAVKAWGLVGLDGRIAIMSDGEAFRLCVYPTKAELDLGRRVGMTWMRKDCRAKRCTITYDDGKPDTRIPNGGG